MITQAWLIVAFMVTPPSLGYKEIYVFKTKDVLTSSEFCLDYVSQTPTGFGHYISRNVWGKNG